jgi:VanZ family protein
VKNPRAFQAWSLVMVYAALIYLVSAISHPFPYIDSVEKYHYDWILHMIEYLVFGWLIVRALVFSDWNQPQVILFFIALTIASLYGVSDEYHQSLVPFRDPAVGDWVADTIGASIGIIIFLQNRIKKVA